MAKRGHLFAVAFLIAGVAALFLKPAEQYFFGDSIGLLWNRPDSWRALLLDFGRLDGSLWFRPLSSSVPVFLLWPVWGLNFFPYHVLALALHLGVSLALFELFRRMFRDTLAGLVSAAFFAFHPIQFYATYDLTFYQEPLMAGLALAALVLLSRYQRSGQPWLLPLGLFCFALALYAKETAVVLPGALLLVLWDGRRPNQRWSVPARNIQAGAPALRDRDYRRDALRWFWLMCARRTAVVLAASAVMSAGFTFYYVRVLGVAFRYQPDYRPQWGFQVFKNMLLALRWAFGLPAGWQTLGWQYPAALKVIFWGVLAGAVASAVFLRGRGLWRGLPWFLGAGLPAFSTHHLLPHHLYFPLLGVAFTVGGMVAWLREDRAPSSASALALQALAWRPWLASAVATASLSALFAAAFLAARLDSVESWVGRSSWETRAVTLFARAARLDLRAARGVMVSNSGPHLTFDWMGGRIFNLLGNDDLEVRLVKTGPKETPAGFYLLEYRDHWLRNTAAALPFRRLSARAAAEHLQLKLRMEPHQVHAGKDRYCLQIPQLPSQSIDLKYRYNQRPALVAYDFTRLDDRGMACLDVPDSIPRGTVDVVAVRPADAPLWSPVQARIEVLR